MYCVGDQCALQMRCLSPLLWSWTRTPDSPSFEQSSVLVGFLLCFEGSSPGSLFFLPKQESTRSQSEFSGSRATILLLSSTLVRKSTFILFTLKFLGAITDNPSDNGTSWGVEITKSYLCPRGYYCESGDITPRPCRNGTYNAYLNASSPLHCQLCALNHFNHLQAQNACFPCGSSASAKHLGSDTCECNGQHRVFMVSIYSQNSG